MSTLVRDSKTGINVGLFQARIELRRYFTPVRIFFALMGPMVVLILIRMGLINWVGGIDVFRWLVSAYVGAALSISGTVTLASTIIGDQEDGTLLRAKTLPGGMLGHISAKSIVVIATSLISIVLTIAAANLASGSWLIKPTVWLAVLPLVVVVAIATTAPIGLIMGGLARKVTDVFYVTIVCFAVIVISDVFVPPGLMPDWLTVIAKLFPVYWLGNLSRLSLLGADSPLVTLTTFDWVIGVFVMIAWLIAGVVFLPRALRKLSRRQSPSRLDKFSNLVGA